MFQHILKRIQNFVFCFLNKNENPFLIWNFTWLRERNHPKGAQNTVLENSEGFENYLTKMNQYHILKLVERDTFLKSDAENFMFAIDSRKSKFWRPNVF